MIRDAIKLSDELRIQISEVLKPLHPETVILFGSYAWGHPGEDSDIDLYVVTQDDFVPSTWRQKRDIVRNVSDRILDLRMRFPSICWCTPVLCTASSSKETAALPAKS